MTECSIATAETTMIYDIHVRDTVIYLYICIHTYETRHGQAVDSNGRDDDDIHIDYKHDICIYLCEYAR